MGVHRRDAETLRKTQPSFYRLFLSPHAFDRPTHGNPIEGAFLHSQPPQRRKSGKTRDPKRRQSPFFFRLPLCLCVSVVNFPFSEAPR